MLTIEEKIWTTALGEQIPFNEIPQQHLSNILWYHEFFVGLTPSNDSVMAEIYSELVNRFKGEKLKWMPLPIPNEIKMINANPNSRIDSFGTIWWNNKEIGTISHIQD